jgi:peptide/nickel transport system substrate-binding protein
VAAIGTGPYKFAAFRRSDRIELVRNEDYWGTASTGKPPWDKVTFKLLTNDTSRLTALLAGEVDAIENVPTQDIKKLRSNDKFTVTQQVSWRTIFWHLDQYRDNSPYITDKNGKPLGRNPFKDPRVRLAISKAIYRDAIVSRIMEGLALPASNLVSPGIFGYNGDIPVEPYDREGAKKLLVEAGYPDGFALTLHAPNNRYVNDSKIAQAVATMLSRIGILTTVQTLPWSVYLGKARAGEFSFMLIGWGSSLGDNTIKSHLATLDEKKGYGTWNFGHYSNPEVDRQLDRTFTLFDDAEREQSTRNIMALAMKDIPVIVMHHQIASWAMRKGLSSPGRVDEFTLAYQFVKQ